MVRLKAGRNVIELGNPVANSRDSAAIQYRRMSQCLKDAVRETAEKRGTAPKPILFSICEWGWRKPWLWGAAAGNMWRTTPDIRPWWYWIKIIYSRNVKLWKYASPGHFNDPDMLEVGNGKLHLRSEPLPLCAVVHDERAARARQRPAQDAEIRPRHSFRPRTHSHRSGRSRQTGKTHPAADLWTCWRSRSRTEA